MKEFVTGEMRVATRYQSHLAPLLACCAQAFSRTKAPVLEIGMGHFSTPQLRAVCANSGIQLVSVELNDQWRELFLAKYPETSWHQIANGFQCITGDNTFSVVLIDDSPGGANRARHFKNFIDVAQFVVVHDYHYDNEGHISPILSERPEIKSRVFSDYEPPTLVASLAIEPAYLTI